MELGDIQNLIAAFIVFLILSYVLYYIFTHTSYVTKGAVNFISHYLGMGYD